MKPQKILVTGAGGFIGSHLCEKLLSLGYQVSGIDCMGGNDNWIKEKNIASCLQHPQFTFIKANLLEYNLPSLLNGVDVIYHLAATAGVRSCWGNNFLPYINNNILATQNLLEAAKGLNLKKFILASTSSVYGITSGPTREDHPTVPLSPYGVTKLAAEHMAAIYQKEFKIPITVLRYFTVYGPRQRPDMAFHIFIKSLLSGQEIKIYGDGRQIRDFTYVKDVINGTIKAMYYPLHGTVFNIGGNTRASVNDIINMLKNITGCCANITYITAQPGEPKQTWADISKTTKSLNYLPNTQLKDGLVAQLKYIKELYGSNLSYG